MHWGTWRVNGQLAVSRAIGKTNSCGLLTRHCYYSGDGEYKPYISAEADVTTVIKNGSEDFLIIACDGLWDTITPEEATLIVFQHLEENSQSGGDIENIGARLATASKDRGSGDNITIIVVFIRPVEELIARGRGRDSGQPGQDIEGVTSTSDYVFMTSRESLEPVKVQSDLVSPNVSFGNLEGGAVFSPDPFANIDSPGAGFNFSSENFDNKIDDKRLSEEESFSAQQMEEILKQQSIAKVEDLFKILDREDCSPTPDEEDARPLEEILAAARLQPQDEVDGVVDDDDSSDDEIVDFGACDNLNGPGNRQLAEVLELDDKSLTEDQEETDTFDQAEVGIRSTYQEPRMDPCEQVTVKETGPEEYSTIVPPVQEMPSQQQPVMELVDAMVCSMVKEEQEQEIHDVKINGTGMNGIHVNGEAESVSFEAKEDVGFMLKTPGETGGEKLAEFSPEQETSVDTGESVGTSDLVNASLVIPNVKVTPATPVKERSPAPLDKKEKEAKEEKVKTEAKGSSSGPTTNSPKKSSIGAKPRSAAREAAVKQVQPNVKSTTRSTPAARSAPTSRPAATTGPAASRTRPSTGPMAGRSKVTDDSRSTKSGSTIGSEKNSKSGTTERPTPKTSSTRTTERKTVVAPKPEERVRKPLVSRPRAAESKEVTKEPRTVTARRPVAASSKTSSNMSGNTSSASSASSSRSKPITARPATATTRTKPEEPKKTGAAARTSQAKTASATSSGRLAGTSSRSAASASATISRAAKSSTPLKPSAAAERVAAARAAAMAKPAAKITKIKSASAVKKGEEKEKKEDKSITNDAAPGPVPATSEVNTNGNDTEKDKEVTEVNPGDNIIKSAVNGLSEVNQSEC